MISNIFNTICKEIFKQLFTKIIFNNEFPDFIKYLSWSHWWLHINKSLLLANTKNLEKKNIFKRILIKGNFPTLNYLSSFQESFSVLL